MNQSELFELMKQFEQSTISRMEYEANGERVSLEKNNAVPMVPAFANITPMPSTESATPASPEVPAAAKQINDAQEVPAPLMGVFYASPSPGESPFVKEGDTVKEGQVLCLIEAMKMINELMSPVSGTVKCIHGKNGELVSFGDILFEVTPC